MYPLLPNANTNARVSLSLLAEEMKVAKVRFSHLPDCEQEHGVLFSCIKL